MIKVNDATKTAYKSDGVQKELEIRIPNKSIVLTNEDLISQSLSLTESIESTQSLSFVGCIASMLKFKCVDIIEDIEGEYIEADLTAEDTTTIPLFRGYIDKTTNPSHEQRTMEIIAYDALYSKINNRDVTAWYNSLTFPITIMDFRNSFFNYLGIEQEADYLPNDGLAITKTFTDKIIKGSSIIRAVCQINGRFGRISRLGKFQYVYLTLGTEALYPREDLYPDEDVFPSAENALDNVSKAHYTTIEFENYRVEPITKVQLVAKSGAIVATAGSGSNIFTVNNNPIVWGLTQAQLETTALNLYNTIQGLWYTPATIKCVGLPYVECGDFVMMAARREIVRAYVLNRTLTGIQALTDNYKAPGAKAQPVYTPSLESKVAANTQSITDEVDRASYSEGIITGNLNGEISRAQGAESRISADVANFKTLTANSLNAANARIDNLDASKASIGQLNAANGRIDNLSASVASINSLVATKASISDLQAANARIDNLAATRVTASWVDARISAYASTGIFNEVRIGGTNYSRSVRIVTTYHAYDVLGNQVY